MLDRHTLDLRPSATATLHGSGDLVHRQFLDFVVDGEPLRRRVMSRVGDVDQANDYASLLVTNWPVDLMADDVRMLLGEMHSPLADGRVPLYVCAECGGLGCGTISAVIEHPADTVIWRDFGWQTDYDPIVDREPFAEVGPFEFGREQYEAALRSAASTRG
jgi:hypothetical protein